MRGLILVFLLLLYGVCGVNAQQTSGLDTTVIYKNQAFTLTDVVVRNNFNIASFVEYVKNDTTFYKAFRNLRIIGFSAFNDINIFDKKGRLAASLHNLTTQQVSNGCRTATVHNERVTGDFYNTKGQHNYTTAEMYASLFFTKGRVCGENNIVGNRIFSAKGKSGMDKHREQLKQLFFNPGTRIAGLPLIGNKVALFDEDVSQLYHYSIDQREFRGSLCYIFTITPRADLSSSQRSNIVIDNMTTWFNAKTLEIIQRDYSLSYNAGIFNFDVDMHVQLEKVGDLLVPKLLRYNGYWKLLFKKPEWSQFTATLFNFKL